MKIYRNDVLNRTILVVAILLVIVGIFAVTLETMRASTLTRSKALDVTPLPIDHTLDAAEMQTRQVAAPIM